VETKTIFGRGVIGALRERGLSQWDAAHAAGLSQGTLNSILQGNIALTPSAKAKIEAAIVELGLAEARVPDAREPVFSVPVKSDE
jgi:transcriptional regulator with XRE-family HTH domain